MLPLTVKVEACILESLFYAYSGIMASGLLMVRAFFEFDWMNVPLFGASGKI